MKWMGKLGDDIEAALYQNGILLSDPKRKCRCGQINDLAEIAERELGAKLALALKNMEDYIHWSKKWNVISEKAVAGKILLDDFCTKRIKLWGEHQRKTKDWGVRDVSYAATALCPKCETNLGEIRVTMRFANPPEIMDLRKNQLVNLEASNEMLAYASKRMRFGSVEELKEWRDDKDAEEAKAILRKTIAEIDQLNLPYEISRITGSLTSLIGEVDKATHERKIEFVNAVEKIVEERVHIIT